MTRAKEIRGYGYRRGPSTFGTNFPILPLTRPRTPSSPSNSRLARKNDRTRDSHRVGASSPSRAMSPFPVVRSSNCGVIRCQWLHRWSEVRSGSRLATRASSNVRNAKSCEVSIQATKLAAARQNFSASVVDQGGSERALDTGTSSATTLPMILRARTGRTTQPPPTDGALNYSSRPAPWTGDSAGRHYSPPPRMSPASAQVPIRAGRSSWPSPASEITA